MERFLAEILRALSAVTELPESELRLEAPRDGALGDFAFPCFLLSKQRKSPPHVIASELAIALAGRVAGVEAIATGPYLNFRVERARLAPAVIEEIVARGDEHGRSSEGAGKTIVVDFSSPNIAKPMHVGHIRSTIIGAALIRLFQALGYRTVGINHIGDWGAQFGGLVVAIRRWKESVDLETDPVGGLLELYQRSKQAIEDDPAFREEARAAYRELESGHDGEVRALWRWVTKISLGGFDATYARLGIQHDLVRGESFYEPYLEPTLERVKAAGVTEISRGALIVDLSGVAEALAKTPCLLQQTDGTTLYATRDLAALFHRWEEFRFERCLYVVGSEQKLHFRQLKAVLARMGCDWQERVEHVDFGLLLGPGRVKLASRKGQVLVLDELIDEVVDEARRIITEKNPDLAGRERVAEDVGVGAIVFNDLKRERVKDVLFDKQEILSFEGETGPYVQYTHARLASILRKAAGAGEGGAQPDWGVLSDAAPILLRLGRFQVTLRSAAAAAEPSQLATYLLSLCRETNAWYVQARVLGQEAGVTAARLALVRACKIVLANGLKILGLRAPEEM